MAQGIMSIRVDNDVRKDINEFSKKVGISVSTLVNLYFKKVIDEQKIPFEISVKKEPDRQGYINAMESLKQEVIDNYPDKLSLKEVNKIYIGFRKTYLHDDDSFGFDPYSKEDLLTSISGSILFEDIREDMSKKFPDGMTLDEINEIIDKTRRGEE